MTQRTTTAILALAPACAIAQPCGSGWQRLNVGGPTGATARMTYDTLRDRVVAVVGSTAAPAQTWLWDGVSWTQAATGPVNPGPGSISYDPTRDVVVLYYASSAPGVRNDQTLEWPAGGGNWAFKDATLDQGLWGTTMAFYPPTGKIIRTNGGYTGACDPMHPNQCPPPPTPTSAYYEWNGATWTALSSSSVQFMNVGLAYHPIRQRLMRDGGWRCCTTENVVTDEWDGTWWTFVANNTLPDGPALLYWDSSRSEMRSVRSGVHRFTGAAWELVLAQQPLGGETKLPTQSMVYDAARGRLMALVQPATPGASLETWVWDGEPTRPVAPLNLPEGTVTERFRPPGLTQTITTGYAFPSGYNPGYTFQWRRNGQPIPGGSLNSLSLSTLACDEYGDYDLVVTNSCGTTISGTYRLRPVGIATPSSGPLVWPTPGWLVASMPLVGATGNPVAGVTYQWYLNGVPLQNGPTITGADGWILNVANPTCEFLTGTLHGEATACGYTAVQGPYQPTIATPQLTISRSPNYVPGTAAVVGDTVKLKAHVVGLTGGAYQWHRNGQPLANGAGVSGATTEEVTLSPVARPHAGDYVMHYTPLPCVAAAQSPAYSLPVRCPGDANNNGVTDFADLNIILANFNTSGPPLPRPGDVNNDGAVNFADLNLALSFFGQSC